MANPNPNPAGRFSSTNQPKTRRKSKKLLTDTLVKKIKKAPDGGQKFCEELADLIIQELRDVKSGKKPMTSVHTKLIDIVLDRVDGPVKQEIEIETEQPFVALIPADVDAYLKSDNEGEDE